MLQVTLNPLIQKLMGDQVLMIQMLKMIIKTENPDMLTAIKTRLPETPISFIPHTEMKQELNNCHAFIRTGEMTPYANILLESNVVF